MESDSWRRGRPRPSAGWEKLSVEIALSTKKRSVDVRTGQNGWPEVPPAYLGHSIVFSASGIYKSGLLREAKPLFHPNAVLLHRAASIASLPRLQAGRAGFLLLVLMT